MMYEQYIRNSSSLAKLHNRGSEVHECLMKTNSLLALRRKYHILPNLMGREMNDGQ